MRIFILIIFLNHIFAIINNVSNPNKINDSDIEIINLPSIPKSILFKKDQRRFKYGHKINVDFGIKNSGVWEFLKNGDSIWRLAIQSSDAFALKLNFDEFYLPKYSELTIYNSLGDMKYGPYTSKDNGTFGSPLIKGELIIIEYYKPIHVTNDANIHLNSVIHDYTDIFNFYDGSRDRDCGENVICESAEEFRDQANAVIYMIINEYTCSGTLLNNVNNDNTPYVLTAWHCIVGETTLGDHNDFVYYFNHESPTCEGSNGSFEFSASGSTLLATRNENVGSDFALLVMDDSPPEEWNPFYAGWSNDESAPLISVGIHHPEDFPRKINYDDDFAYSCAWNTADTHWCLSWDNGGTSDGSSGSALFNSDKQIIGANTGSDGPNCSPGPDLYGKFSLSWDGGNNSTRRLKEWLDPDETGVISINGIYTNSDLILGDLNNDTNVNVLDAIILVNHILSPSTIELDNSDINNDNNIDVLDVVQLINLILNS